MAPLAEPELKRARIIGGLEMRYFEGEPLATPLSWSSVGWRRRRTAPMVALFQKAMSTTRGPVRSWTESL